jgi:hypothetical protein
MMPWLLIITLLIVAGAIYLIATAPVGYQDDDGFHYGKPDEHDKDFF